MAAIPLAIVDVPIAVAQPWVASVFCPIAVEYSPLAVLCPIAVEVDPLAVLPPVAVEELPLAIEPEPIATE